MRKRTLILGLVGWLGFFALGVQWMFNPFGVKIVNFHAIKHEIFPGAFRCDCDVWAIGFPTEPLGKNMEQTQRQFPLRLARLDNSGLRDYGDRILNESTDEVAVFDYWDWAFRESCSRFVVFTVVWLGSGWFIQWWVTRIVRGPGRLVR